MICMIWAEVYKVILKIQYLSSWLYFKQYFLLFPNTTVCQSSCPLKGVHSGPGRKICTIWSVVHLTILHNKYLNFILFLTRRLFKLSYKSLYVRKWPRQSMLIPKPWLVWFCRGQKRWYSYPKCEVSDKTIFKIFTDPHQIPVLQNSRLYDFWQEDFMSFAKSIWKEVTPGKGSVFSQELWFMLLLYRSTR